MTASLDAIRQAAAEILAYTVRDIVPDTLFVKGEHTDIGFTYDFILSQDLDKEAIPIIEERMRINTKKGLLLKSVEMMRENAAEMFEHHGQAIQANLVLLAPGNIVPICQIDSFYDFCHLPYAPNSKEIVAFKILSINKEPIHIPGMGDLEVTRITGTAFLDKDSLKQFLKKLEQAKENDYRTLGKEKDLFLFENDKHIWLPKGVKIRETIVNWWKKEQAALGYSFVISPSHSDVYHHFNPALPARYAEMDSDHDKATTFCTQEQMQEEINKSLQFILKTSNMLGFGNQWYLVTPNNRDKAIEPLIEGLKKSGINYQTEIRKIKNPRIEVRWVDFLGREWMGSTLTVSVHKIVMITRSSFESLERCIALLVEQYGNQKENVAESFEQQ